MVSKKVVFCIYNLALSFMIRRSGLCTWTQQEDVVYTLYLSDNLSLTFFKVRTNIPYSKTGQGLFEKNFMTVGTRQLDLDQHKEQESGSVQSSIFVGNARCCHKICVCV